MLLLSDEGREGTGASQAEVVCRDKSALPDNSSQATSSPLESMGNPEGESSMERSAADLVIDEVSLLRFAYFCSKEKKHSFKISVKP